MEERQEEDRVKGGKKMDGLLRINASTCQECILRLREGAERMGVSFFFFQHLLLLKTAHFPMFI